MRPFDCHQVCSNRTLRSDSTARKPPKIETPVNNNNKDVQATKLAVCARDLCTSWEVLNWEPRKLRATCTRKLLTVCARRARLKVWLIDRKAQSLLDSQVRHILASSTRMSSTGTTPCPSVGNHISCHYIRQWQLAKSDRDESCPPMTIQIIE